MSVLTRIKNNQITDATITAAKLVNNTITAGKLEDDLTYGSNLTVTGNLTVNGTTTTVSTTNTTVEDAVMVLNSDATGSYANDTGLYLERGDNTSVFMGYDGSDGKFALVETDSAGTVSTINVTDYADLHIGGLTADDAITATGNVTGGNLITSALVSAATVTATGTVTGDTLTDGTASINSGAITGATSGSFSTTLTATGNITGGNLITSALVSAATVTATGNVTGGNLLTSALTQTGSLTVLASGTIQMNQNIVGNIGEPVASSDAATKNYVDTALSSVFTITDGTTSQVIADGDTLTFAGTANEVEVAVSATDTVTIGLPSDVTIGNNLTVTGDLTVNGTTTTVNSTTSTLQDPIFQLGRGADNAALSADDAKDRGVSMYYYEGSEKIAFMGFDTTNNNFTFVPDASISGEVVSGSAGAATFGAITGTSLTDGTATLSSGSLTSAVNGTFSGTVTGGTVTDGAFSATSGAVTGVTTLSTSGEATLASAIVSDLTATRVTFAGSSGALVDDADLTYTTASNTLAAGNISSAGTVTGGTLTDGTASITGGAGTGFTSLAVDNVTINGNDITATTALTFNEAGGDMDFRVESDNNANMLFIDAGTDSVNIGTGTPTTDVSFKVGTTDSMMMPIGNTAQRPVTPVVGMIRFSTTNDSLEQYSSVDGWEVVGAPSFTVISSETFDGDNATVAFTLSDSQTTASCIVSINGVLQLPTTAYGVSGTTLTFTEAPLSGDKIEVRKITTTTTLTNLTSTAGGAVVSTPNEEEVDVKGNLMPAADSTYSIGNSTVRWTDIYVDAGTIHLGAIQLKESGGSLAVFASDGTTAASISNDSVDATTIVNGTSNVAVAENSSVTVTVGGSTAATFAAGGLTVAGNLTVSGTTTTVNSTTLDVADKNITVASGAADSSAADGAGLTVAGASATITYAHTGTKWVLNKATDVQSLLIGGTAVTSTAAELNILDGVTSTAAELNLVDGSSAGTVVNSKAVVYGASGEVNATTLQVGGVAITATPAELNVLDGITSTTAELNKLDGFTGGVTELNYLDALHATGVTDTEFDYLDGVTSNIQTQLDTKAPTASPSFTTKITTPDIDKSGTNGVGDIGQTDNRFGTVYGLATSAQYADLAEKYEADADYEPGTVVHFGGDKEVSECDVDHCTKVAGVVSTDPAYRMNDALEAEHVAMVALQGRVPCKVTGPVAKGDMMVSAGNGHARAEANPKVGAVIGKALENWEGGEGVIEVVVGKH